MKTIADKYYDAVNSKMYDKSANLLDILLVGKYGSRRINALTKDFANNLGVIIPEDKEVLADVIVSYYKDIWDRKYSALTAEYDPLKPYRLSREESVEESGTSSSTVTSESSGTDTTEGTDTTTFDTTNTETKNLTNQQTLNISDKKTGTESTQENGGVTESNEIVTDDDTRTETLNDTDTKTTTFNNVTDTDTKSGSVSKLTSGSVVEKFDTDDTKDNTVSTEVVNNDPTKIDQSHFGSEHTVEQDVTSVDANKTSESRIENAVAPYAPVNMRIKSEDIGHKDDNSVKEDNVTEHNLELERTTDYSIQDNTVTTKQHTEKDTTYNNHGETETYNNLADTNVKSGSISESDVKNGVVEEAKDVTVTETKSKDINDLNTTTYNTEDKKTGTDTETQTGTDTNAKTGTETVGVSETVTRSDEGTVSTQEENGKEIGTTVSETGNRWGFTNQELINAELELRKNNFYESILNDVAQLLTLSVYSKEDL